MAATSSPCAVLSRQGTRPRSAGYRPGWPWPAYAAKALRVLPRPANAVISSSTGINLCGNWRMHRLLFVVLSAVLLSACSTVPERSSEASARVEPDDVVPALYAQYDAWAGTPYRFGGLSRRGVDCSGFVQLTYQSRFGRTLPRTTEELARVGRPVARHDLRAGDLVFFRTGRLKRTPHVGIYVENGVFLHASTSRGVTLSRLDSPYWAAAYNQARRP